MPDPKNKKNTKVELPEKVDNTRANNLKMVLEKHKRQSNKPIDVDRKILDNKFKKGIYPEMIINPINMVSPLCGKINPKTAKAMHKAGMEANKEKIAQDKYGEFGFDTLTYDQQQEVYKNYPKLPKSKKDIGSDFETPANMESPLYKRILTPISPFNKSRCWTGYEPVPGKKPYSKGSCRKK